MTGDGHSASKSQYETPTPVPPIGTPTVGPSPTPGQLPHTGSDVAYIAVPGAGLLLLGIAAAMIRRRLR